MVFDKKTYLREYRKKNKNKVREWNKRYKEHNPDKVKESCKKYIENNPDKFKESQKKYKEKNIEKCREYGKGYRKNNLERASKNNKKWAQNNKEKIKAHRIASKIPMDDSCNICHSTENLERHHWRYDQPKVFSTLCIRCHQIQHGRIN